MEKGWKRYHTIWTMLFLGWFVSYMDRSLTGPIITWMINNKVDFLQAADNPYALGGLLGSLFFAGYMLTQFPGGYFGDKYGYRTIILISIFWAGITTLLTGLIGGLIFFIAMRVLTGLGEGVFYSNDRSLIAQVTPPKKLGLGMGIVISGLSLGLAAATFGTPYLINLGVPLLGEGAWKFPFILMGIVTIILGMFLIKFLKPSSDNKSEKAPFGPAFVNLLKYSAFFMVVIMGLYFTAQYFGLSEVGMGVCLSVFAILFIVYIYKSKSEQVRPVLKNKNLVLLYLSGIPIVWHLWLYGFWSVSIVQDFTGGTLQAAAIVASFNVIAGLIGYPLGGKFSDMAAAKKNGRRNFLAIVLICLTACIFGLVGFMASGSKSMIMLSIILFVSGLFFFATQTVSHTLTAELSPLKHRGSAFGMWNLVSEFGALLSPVVSGALRGATGNWESALLLDGVLMAVCFVLVLSIRSPKAATVSAAEAKTV